MLSVKQGGIKYHFLSLWYDSTWNEPRFPGRLANTLTAWPMSGYKSHFFCKNANYGLPCYIKKKEKYTNVDENIDEF